MIYRVYVCAPRNFSPLLGRLLAEECSGIARGVTEKDQQYRCIYFSTAALGIQIRYMEVGVVMRLSAGRSISPMQGPIDLMQDPSFWNDETIIGGSAGVEMDHRLREQ